MKFIVSAQVEISKKKKKLASGNRIYFANKKVGKFFLHFQFFVAITSDREKHY